MDDLPPGEAEAPPGAEALDGMAVEETGPVTFAATPVTGGHVSAGMSDNAAPYEFSNGVTSSARKEAVNGVAASTSEGPAVTEQIDEEQGGIDDAEAAALLDAASGSRKLSKAPKKRQRGKAKKTDDASVTNGTGSSLADGAARQPDVAERAGDVTIEYVVPDVSAQLAQSSDAQVAAFAEVFKAFQERGVKSAGPVTPEEAAKAAAAEAKKAAGEEPGKAEGADDDADSDADSKEGEDEAGAEVDALKGMSRKQRKRALMDSLAELKRAVAHPEVVEAFDVFAQDPKLLVHLKAGRNSVPVPRHWCKKSRYLQRKVGFEKPPFQLPEFIAATGISKLRNADLDGADEKTLKAKQRDRYMPKLGRIEIDYEVLHDAFFKHQTKPALTPFGDLYYEGRELEQGNDFAATKKPGVISERLRDALGMHEGAPPPWLVKMQQYGPPPSYPRLQIPGVNAPLPPGAQYGMHPGGWGRPPVDEFGRPLYGDVFGAAAAAADGVGPGDAGAAGAAAAALVPEASAVLGSARERSRWGELGATEGGIPGVTRAAGAAIVKPVAGTAAGVAAAVVPAGATVVGADGTATPADGTLSVPSSIGGMSGLETPDIVNIRKGQRAGGGASTAGIDTPSSIAGPPGAGAGAPALYQVLEQKQTGLQGGLLGTTHAYLIPKAGEAGSNATVPSAASSGAGGVAGGGVAIALAPEELERLNEASIAEKYQAEVAAAAAGRAIGREDVSDVVEERERKRTRKEAGLPGSSGGAGGAAAGGSKSKKARDFKF
jgi:splicing factor 3B subunit 2